MSQIKGYCRKCEKEVDELEIGKLSKGDYGVIGKCHGSRDTDIVFSNQLQKLVRYSDTIAVNFFEEESE